MFGLSDTTTDSNDDPKMLNNVKQLAQEPASSITPTTQVTATPIQQQLNTTSLNTSTPAPTMQSFTVNQPTVAQQLQTTGVNSSNMTPSNLYMPPTSSQPQAQQTPSSAVADPEEVPLTPPTDSSPSETTNTPDHDQLAILKREALSHLETLQDHLDGAPEEVFKTTMMMIQANDNHALLGKALEAAKKISDDKERALAMLDIINEINYFAQNSQAE